MTTWTGNAEGRNSWFRSNILMGMTWPDYLRSLNTPFNYVAAAILAIGIPLTWIRFTQGIGAVTNLNDNYPWGLWIGFDVMCGVALAAGGYCLATAVHILGLKKYYPVVRPAILTGFLGYFFVVVGLCFDLGRPWRLPYPMAVSYGVTSVMFLVGWHVALYLTVQFLEFSPAIFEWLKWKKWLAWATRLTIGATVFGVILSTLHQSALGAMFLMAPVKLHPLWYSAFIPVFFFISSIAAGLSMVIFEGSLSHRIFGHQISHSHHKQFDEITLGLGKAAAMVLFTYLCLKLIGVAHGNHWDLIFSSYGSLFLLEIIGFVTLPMVTYLWGIRNNNAKIVRIASLWTVLGIIFNRLNVSIFAFNWQLSERYFPNWKEYAVTITIVTLGLLTFRWIVNRMPVLYADKPNHPGD